jgi:hypothetical protein
LGAAGLDKKVEVLDVLGNSRFETNSIAGQIPIDLRALSSGVYYLRILVGDNTVTRRIVKE